MIVDDLAHLSVVTDKSLLPRIDFKPVEECSEETMGDTILMEGLFCLITRPSYQNIAPIPYGKVKEKCVSAVASNPLEYVNIRFIAYLYLLNDPLERPYIYWFSVISPNEIGLNQKDHGATAFLNSYVSGMAPLV